MSVRSEEIAIAQQAHHAKKFTHFYLPFAGIVVMAILLLFGGLAIVA